MSVTLTNYKFGELTMRVLAFHWDGCLFDLNGEFLELDLDDKKHMKKLEKLGIPKEDALFGEFCQICGKVAKVIMQVNKGGGGWYTSVSCPRCGTDLYDDFPEEGLKFNEV